MKLTSLKKHWMIATCFEKVQGDKKIKRSLAVSGVQVFFVMELTAFVKSLCCIYL